jgi:hypothetical protein
LSNDFLHSELPQLEGHELVEVKFWLLQPSDVPGVALLLVGNWLHVLVVEQILLQVVQGVQVSRDVWQALWTVERAKGL